MSNKVDTVVVLQYLLSGGTVQINKENYKYTQQGDHLFFLDNGDSYPAKTTDIHKQWDHPGIYDGLTGYPIYWLPTRLTLPEFSELCDEQMTLGEYMAVLSARKETR